MANINDVIREIKKKHGEKSIKTGGEIEQLKVFRTNIPSLDVDLGGGLLMGRITEIQGKESSAKTSSCYHLAAQFQKKGFPVFWIDWEKAFDPIRASVFGLDPESVAIMKPDADLDINTAEHAFDYLRSVMLAVNSQENTEALFIFDSLGSLVTQALLEKNAVDTFESGAKTTNQIVKVANVLLKSNQCLIFVNQLRDSVGQMYGPANYAPGGTAQRYLSSTIIETRLGEVHKDSNVAIGQDVRYNINKSRSGSPRQISNIKFLYVTGFQLEHNLLETAIDLGLFEKSGAWFVLPDGTRIQGKDRFVEKLITDKKLLEEVKALVYSEETHKKLNRVWYEEWVK